MSKQVTERYECMLKKLKFEKGTLILTYKKCNVSGDWHRKYQSKAVRIREDVYLVSFWIPRIWSLPQDPLGLMKEVVVLARNLVIVYE